MRKFALAAAAALAMTGAGAATAAAPGREKAQHSQIVASAVLPDRLAGAARTPPPDDRISLTQRDRFWDHRDYDWDREAD